MKFTRWLIALGIGAYLVFLLFTLPAGLLFGRLESFNLRAAGVTGTVWHGKAAALQLGALPLGQVEWRLKKLPLLLGRASADVSLARSDGFVKSRVSSSLGGRVRFEDLSATLPLAALRDAGFPGGWTGTAQLRFEQLELQQGWPVDALGTLDLDGLTGPARQPVNLGTYRVSFAGEGDQGLVGNIEDQQAMLSVAGTLKLNPDRSYLVEARVAARPNAPASMSKALQFLGPPDAQGRRELSLSGTM